MPQLDLSTYASQAFWIVLCFCCLWLMVSLFITPKITDILEQRKRLINNYIYKAEKLNNQAKKSIERYENALAEAKEKAAADIARNQKELVKYLEDSEHDVTERLNKKVADSELALAKEKKSTLMNIEAISQDLAFEIIQKLGFTEITRNEVKIVAEEEQK